MDIERFSNPSVSSGNHVRLTSVFPGDMADKLLIENPKDGFLVIMSALGEPLEGVER